MKLLKFAFMILFVLSLNTCLLSDNQQTTNKFNSESRMNAPEFPAGLTWLNTDSPLRISDLKGKIVLLDFWTYCCINCLHIIPDLKRLEHEFAEELVVIGVHSAKFLQEQDTENIRQAILRYEIEHPVVNDHEFQIWKTYQIRAWPSTVLIDPQGRLVTAASGEGVYERHAQTIRKLITEFDAQKLIDRQPLALKLESSARTGQFLAYPGKVLADPGEDRIFISDQNHNRIVVASLVTGEVQDLIGSGELGFRDGSFEQAQFNHPQGLALVGDKLYVADTENHAVRELDLTSREVSTLAGTGNQAGIYQQAGTGPGVQLSSPWDLVEREGMLYVAMAGTHQIWTIRLSDAWTAPFAGNSREGLRDGVRTQAWLAQPSGLTISGDVLYFADSEVSAIRSVELHPAEGRVGTVVGEGLFEFGDIDGRGSKVRLQHPLGVTTDGTNLYVADTYNSKIKIINPVDRSSRTLAGDGNSQLQDGAGEDASFYEPGGIHYAKGKLYVADTNNHAIRVIDLATQAVSTLRLTTSGQSRSAEFTKIWPLVEVAPGAGSVFLDFQLADGLKLSPGSVVVVESTASGDIMSESDQRISFSTDEADRFELPVSWLTGQGDLILEVSYTYCGSGDNAVCWAGLERIQIPIEVQALARNKTLAVKIDVAQD